MSFVSRLSRAAPVIKRSYATVSDAAGVKVAGIEGAAAPGTSSITVVVKAGSRYETKPGVAHVLKNFAYKSTASGSALRTAREAELYGGTLSAALSREHLYLTAEFLRGDESHFLDVLASVLSSSHFHQHEYAELVLPTIENESIAAMASPSILALDIAHALAFRKGLGNSLFASAHAPITASDVKSYAQNAYAKSNIAVLGAGMSTEDLSALVRKSFGSGSGSGGLATPTTKYHGGEQRVPIDYHIAPQAQPTLLIAYGSESAASADLKVLPHLLGGQTSVKWTTGTSPLSLIASKVPGAKAEAFLLPYSDASLFGVIISAPTDQGLKSIASEVAKQIKSVTKVKDEDVKKAIAKAKFADATKTTTSLETLLSVTGPALFSGDIPSADASFASLEKVSASSIGKAAESLFKGKPTVVAIGDLGVLPYADELGL